MLVDVRNAWPGETLVLDVTPRRLEPAAFAVKRLPVAVDEAARACKRSHVPASAAILRRGSLAVYGTAILKSDVGKRGTAAVQSGQ